MRARVVVLLAVLGCGMSPDGDGTGDPGGGTGDPSDEPQGMVKIDGEGMVTVKAQGGAELAGSPFGCTGGNCSADVATTARSITFTPVPVATSTFVRATIERGGNAKTTVNPTDAIAVDPSVGWVLQVTFEDI